MTTTPPEAPTGPPPPDPSGDGGPRVTRDEIRDLGRLRRSITDRKVAGVAGGLGRHLDIDPLVLRVAFVVLVFFGGAGLILYGACWLLLPGDNDERATINLDERTRSIVLIGVGVLAAVALVGDSWGAFWFPWPLAIIALVALWLLTRNNPPAGSTTPPVPPAAPTYPTVPPMAPDQPNPYAAAAAPASYPPQPPPYVAPPAFQRVPNPRKRGPILFWFTLALIALGEGVLGIIDLAGADIAAPAYPALAVAICGVMLVVGSVFGRAGGIIAVGLVASVALAGATAGDQWEGETLTPTPTSAAAVQDSYRIDAGEIVLDLRDVDDVAALDGRTIEVDADFGHLEVILPGGLGATVSADVHGPGNIKLFGQEHGGIDVSQNEYNGSVTGPQITIDAELSVGEIEVHR